METDKSPFFSIISVSRNNLPGLQKTHNSLKNQSFQGFQWVVIDGASMDGTVSYLQSTPANWASEPDNGIYDAMNKGIDKAYGQYVLFLNAGDTLASAHTLEKIHESVKNAPADFIYGDSYEAYLPLPSGRGIKGEGLFYKPARAHESRTLGMFTHHQAMLYARAAIGDLRYDTRYKISGDYDFTCRFLMKTQNILYIPAPLCIFESGGMSQQKAMLGRREQFRARKNLQSISAAENIFIYGAQSMLWNFRKKLPGLYWKLKSSGNNASGSGQI